MQGSSPLQRKLTHSAAPRRPPSTSGDNLLTKVTFRAISAYKLTLCCSKVDHTVTKLGVEIEPLEPDLWFAALAQLSRRRAAAAGGGVETLLRHAYHLVQLAPAPLRTVVRSDLDEVSFEALLECEAFDSAAMALVGPPAGFTLRCATGSRRRLFHASVQIDGQPKPLAEAPMESLACALLGAWINALLALRQRSTGDRSLGPALHTPPAGLHPKSIEP